ncbi:retrotransposon protein, putative, ty1-copia subclass [Tanacetum coccineum]
MFVIEQPIPPAPAADSEANELKSMLEKQARVERFDLIQTFHACKQEEGKPDLSVGLILNGLTSDFARFVRNYNMHNMEKTIGKIHHLLIEYEKGLPKKDETPQVMMIKRGKIQKANKKSLKAKAKDDTCNHCKEVGHWKRNCPVYLAELLKKKKQVGTEFREARNLKQGDLYLYVCNGVHAQVEAIGNFDLVLPNGLVICLDNYHYAPSITRGVVSVNRLVENRFVQCFTDFGISVSKNNVLYFNVIPSNGIYEIDMHDLVPNDNSIYNVFKNEVKINCEKTIKLFYQIEVAIHKPEFKDYLNLSGMLRHNRPSHLMKQDKPDKLQQRSVKCIFIGYPKETMGYYFYFPPENKIVVARYAKFFEKSLITQEVSGRAVDLEEIQDEDTSTFEITSEIPMEVKGFEPPQEEVIPIRRSEMTHQAPTRLCLNVEAEEHSLGDLNKPTNYKASMLDSKS